jgi:hypothetical protein
VGNDKLDAEKKFGNLQVQAAEMNRKIRNIESDLTMLKEDLGI